MTIFQLFASKIIFPNGKKDLQKDDGNDNTNIDRTSRERAGIQGNTERNNKRKVVVTEGSFLNGINERGFSKHQQVKIQNFPGVTNETILKEIDTLH